MLMICNDITLKAACEMRCMHWQIPLPLLARGMTLPCMTALRTPVTSRQLVYTHPIGNTHRRKLTRGVLMGSAMRRFPSSPSSHPNCVVHFISASYELNPL